MSNELDVVVIGAGHAGLAVSRELRETGISHLVLERGRVGQTWRDRWESFCSVAPNWGMQLPGQPYDGEDPEAFYSRDELVAYLERYASQHDTPVREGIDVRALDPLPGGGFRLETSAEVVEANTVVLCTGAYQRPCTERQSRPRSRPTCSRSTSRAMRRQGHSLTARY